MKLKIMCTGEIEVDFHDLKDLQLTSSGKSLKATSQEKIDKLAKSLEEYGIVNNLQVWVDGEDIYCFDAHHRKKALSQLEKEGLEIPLLPATRCLAKTIDEAKKLLILKESSNSWIDTNVIKDYLDDIDFDIEEAKSLIEIPDFEWPEEKTKNDPDKLPDEPARVVIKKGDLIELGDHCLLCGDSTDKKQVELLMNGEKLDMVFTDPPYGVSYAAKNEFLNKKDKGNRIQVEIKNDHMTLEETGELWKKCFQAWAPYHKQYSSYYIFSASQAGLLYLMFKTMSENKHPYRHEILWVKNNHVLGRADYNYKHEPLLYGWQHKHKFYGYGDQKFSVWNYDKPVKNDLHPTMKPVELIVNAILNSTERNMSVGDYFAGSGPTLIACEKTNRKCYGMELDEKYCQVIIQRWCDYAEKTEIKINGDMVNWNDYINQ